MLRQLRFLANPRQAPLRAGLFSSTSSRLTSQHRQLFPTGKAQQRLLSSARNTSQPRSSTVSRWRLLSPRITRNIRHNSGKPSSATVQEHGSQASLSIRERFKELSRKYGWAAVGVYFGLSVLDFPFCFLAVRLIGPDRIGEAEHAVVHGFWNVVSVVMPSMRPENKAVVEAMEDAEARETHSIATAAEKEKETASIWTQLLLAYGVHKSLIFFRVPLTAAVTPKIVKTLRGWGYNVGKRGTFKNGK